MLDQARLPNPGVAGDQEPLARAGIDRTRQRGGDSGDLRFPPDERPTVRCLRPALVDVEQAECRHTLRLALELERLDRLDLDEVAHEPVRQLAEEHLACPGSLLEAGRGVDRIAGDQSLPGRRVACDHFPGVDTDAVLERDPVCLLETLVQGAQGILHAPGGADSTERVVLVNAGEAEDRHDRIADELLDRASVLRYRPLIASK